MSTTSPNMAAFNQSFDHFREAGSRDIAPGNPGARVIYASQRERPGLGLGWRAFILGQVGSPLSRQATRDMLTAFGGEQAFGPPPELEDLKAGDDSVLVPWPGLPLRRSLGLVVDDGRAGRQPMAYGFAAYVLESAEQGVEPTIGSQLSLPPDVE